MFMRLNAVVLLLCCLSISQSFACDNKQARIILNNLQWLTEDYPPYNFINQDQQLVGTSTDILLAIFKALGLDKSHHDINVIPWARLYYQMEDSAKYAAFSMLSTPERERNFVLVPMPQNERVSILVLKERLGELLKKTYQEISVAVVREDIGHQLIESNNLPVKQVVTTSAKNMLKMLSSKRVDAVAYSESVVYYQFDKYGDSNQQIVPLLVLDEEAHTNFVFHQEMDKCVVELFKNTLAKLNQQNQITPIYKKYVTRN